MTGIEKTSFWGVEKPPSGVSYTGGGGVGAPDLAKLVNMF